MKTPPKRFAEDLVALVHSGALPRATALRWLAEQETSLRTAIERDIATRKAITLARETILQCRQRIEADQSRRRIGGMKTGALQRATAEQNWPKFLAEHDALVVKGMKPKAAREEVRTQNNCQYNDNYFRAELNRRRQKA